MIWEFADVLGRRLVFWGAISVVAGLALVLAGDPFWRGVGAMFLAWGAVDAVIGVGARVVAERNRRASIGDVARRARDTRAAADDPPGQRRARCAVCRARRLARRGRGLGRLARGCRLGRRGPGRVPARCSISSMRGGCRRPGRCSPTAWSCSPAPATSRSGSRGWPAPVPRRLIVPRPSPVPAAHRPEAAPGAAAAHRPEAVRGALLVHGFAGTPKEMRGLAAVLASAGLGRRGAAAPGARRGQVRDIADYRVEDWSAEV